MEANENRSTSIYRLVNVTGKVYGSLCLSFKKSVEAGGSKIDEIPCRSSWKSMEVGSKSIKADVRIWKSVEVSGSIYGRRR